MSSLPPPPPPPPPGPPPGPPPASPGDPTTGDGAAGLHRTRRRTPLSEVPSPYGLWIATFSVLIMVSPNLVVLGLGGAAAVETVTLESTTMIVVNLVVSMVLQLLVFGFALLPLLFAGRPFSRLLGPTKLGPGMLAVALVTGIAVTVVTYLANAIAVLATGTEEPVEQQLLQDALAGGPPLVLVMLIAVVVAPLVEEVIFRGVLFRALADRIGLAVGLVVSSAVFALIHIEVVFSQPVALVGLFTVGLLLALAYHLTGSLAVPIIGHAVFNAASLSLAVLVDRLDLDDLVALSALVAPLSGH